MTKTKERIVADLTEKVKAALALDEHSLNHRIEMDPGEALAFVKNDKSYNCYDTRKVSLMIRRINAIIPRMDFGGDNPNNGRPHHTFEIGNESSRVIYVVIRRFNLNGMDDDETMRLVGQIDQAAKDADADERQLRRFDDRVVEFRIWWD